MPMPPITALYSLSDIREIEQASLATLPEETLMHRAGQATAQLALGLLANASMNARVVAVAGPGNNGGDAIEAARLLAEDGLDVTLLLCAEPGSMAADAAHMLQRARNGPLDIVNAESVSLASMNDKWDLAIDGLFGIGLTRPITGFHRNVVEWINSLPCPVLALDVPSGLDADTGAIVGEDGVAVRASHTITFIADKPGLHTLYGRDYAGHVHVARLEIDERLFKPSHANLNAVDAFSGFLKKRRHNTHKGSFGDVINAAPGAYSPPLSPSRLPTTVRSRNSCSAPPQPWTFHPAPWLPAQGWAPRVKHTTCSRERCTVTALSYWMPTHLTWPHQNRACRQGSSNDRPRQS